MRLPRSDEFNSVAEDEDRRLFMTGSVCLDRFMVETDLLSASTNKSTQTAWDTNRRTRELSTETLTRWTDRIKSSAERMRTEKTAWEKDRAVKLSTACFSGGVKVRQIYTISPPGCLHIPKTSLVPRVFLLSPGKSKVQEIWETFMGHFHMKLTEAFWLLLFFFWLGFFFFTNCKFFWICSCRNLAQVFLVLASSS